MAQMRVFVSHSHEDGAFCRALVQGLRRAGADVWYDEHNLGSGQLIDKIEAELRQRTVFVLVLSPAALRSQWVRDETKWAYAQLRRDPSRIILPVVAGPLVENDIWLFLHDFKRIEAPGLRPYQPPEAIARTMQALQLTLPGETPLRVAPGPSEGVGELVTRGNALRAQGRHAEALPLYQRGTQIDARSFDAWFNYAFTLDDLGRYAEALTAIDRALALDPTSAVAWNNRSVTLKKLGRQAEALAAIDRALALDATNPLTWYNRGTSLGALGRYAEALAAFERALDLNPKFTEAWRGKGASLLALGRYSESLVAVERALAIEPNHAPAWQTKGNALKYLQRHADALVALDRALAIDPRETDTWVIKGTVLWDLKRYDEEIAAYDRALAIDPNCIDALRYKAVTLRVKGRVPEAEALEQRVKALGG